MKIFFETSLKNLIILLIDKNFIVLDKIIKKDLIKKADLLPIKTNELLERNNLKMSNIDSFFITMGPGSFMGARTSLVYARTICQITKAKLFSIDTIDLISKQTKQTKQIFIDAKGGYSYTKINNEFKLVTFKESSKLNLDYLINNFKTFLPFFKKEKNLIEIKPYYIKEPKIGRF